MCLRNAATPRRFHFKVGTNNCSSYVVLSTDEFRLNRRVIVGTIFIYNKPTISTSSTKEPTSPLRTTSKTKQQTRSGESTGGFGSWCTWDNQISWMSTRFCIPLKIDGTEQRSSRYNFRRSTNIETGIY